MLCGWRPGWCHILKTWLRTFKRARISEDVSRKIHYTEVEIRKEGKNRERKRGRVYSESGRQMKQPVETPEMTAATREQHANPWKSFPASSKTFMEF